MNDKQRKGGFGLFILGALSIISIPLTPPHFSTLSIVGVLHGAMSGMVRTLQQVKAPLAACMITLVVLAVGSLLRGEPLFQRNILSIISMTTAIISCSAFCRGSLERLLVLVSGFALGWVLWILIFPSQFTGLGFDFLWKYGIATPLTVLAACYVIHFKWRPSLQALLLGSVGVASIFLNFRSHGVICLLAGVLVMVKSISYSRESGKGARRIVSIGLFAIMLVPIAVLPQLMKSGYFGLTVQQKTIEQADSGPLFFAGRNEPPLAFEVISEAPIAGWGALENVPDSVVQDALMRTVELGMTNQNIIYSGWYRNGTAVNLHSVLTSHWAEGGFLAIALPLFMLVAAIRALIRCPKEYRVLVYYVGIQVFWDCLFSPFDNYIVKFWGYACVLLLWAGRQSTHNHPPTTRYSIATRFRDIEGYRGALK